MSADGWICDVCKRLVFMARVWDDRVVCSRCDDGSSSGAD